MQAVLTLRRAIDRLSIYLPVALMGVLALATAWLVRISPRVPDDAGARGSSSQVDYTMSDFSVRTFAADGTLKAEVSGARVRHFPVTDTLEVDQARIRSIDRQGRSTDARAVRALSNGDGTEVQLFGDALVVREAGVGADGQSQPRIEFRGEFLHAFTDTERVISHKPVTMIRGATTASADAFEFDNLERTARFTGRVRATLQPSSATQAPVQP